MQPATNSPIAGCSCENLADFAFAYIGTDERLYQYVWRQYYDSAWLPIDLISEWQSVAGVSLPFPRPPSGLRGGRTLSMNSLEPPPYNPDELQGKIYLFYIDVNNHIQALQYPLIDDTLVPPGGTLVEAMNPDLTLRTGAPIARSDSGLASYGWAGQTSQHVVYIGMDGNVWELYQIEGEWDNTVRGGPLWQSNNLSERTGYVDALTPKRNSPLAATMFEREGTEHVVYIAQDNTIRELYFYNGGWGGNNLSQATGAVPPAVNSPLSVYATNYDDVLHVVYLGDDGLVHELYWTQGGWHPDHPISQVADAKPASDTDIIGYTFESNQSQHVVFIDVNNDIQELYNNGSGWGATNLILSSEGDATPPISTASPLVGYAYGVLNQQHVYYIDNLNRLHELAFDKGRWYAAEAVG
jgi:Fungal fucose-specific lectin